MALDNGCHKCAKDTSVLTNADRIRTMSDEELADELILFDNLESAIHYCRNLEECEALLDEDGGIPLDKCRKCMLDWLRRPAEDK